jgi:hypothetical protein
VDFDDTKAFEKKYRTYKELRKMIKILFVCYGNILKNPGKTRKINDCTAQ